MARQPSTFALLLLVLFVADVAAAGIKVPVHRGETATFFVTIINRSATQGEAVFRSAPFESGESGAYAIAAPGSACSVSNGAIGGHDSLPVELHSGPIPAGTQVRCALQVHRAETSFPIAWLHFGVDDANAQIMLRETDWIFGSLVNISLRSEQLVPFPAVGESTGLVRVTATNHGSWDLDRVDFGACQGAVVAPFWLDGGFPGGCDDEAYGPTCFAVGPPSMQFALHNLPAGESRSCLLRATAYAPLTRPIRFGLSLVEEWGLWSGDEQVFDDDGSDDDVVIELSPSTPAGTSSTEVPSASTSMLVILAGLLALAAVRRSGAIR